MRPTWWMIGLVAAMVAGNAVVRGGNQEEDFQSFLTRFESGLTGFVNGRPSQWLANVSRRDDATLMGGWGAFERGWSQLEPRYAWAASQFQESGAKVKVEYLSTSSSGDLAYTVAIERSTVRLSGREQPAPMALRVTHVFRREDGVWRLVHRHADHIIEKVDPARTPSR